jgi:hypothetical protein
MRSCIDTKEKNGAPGAPHAGQHKCKTAVVQTFAQRPAKKQNQLNALRKLMFWTPPGGAVTPRATLRATLARRGCG